MKIGIGSDHAGFKLKQDVVSGLGSLGHAVTDFGPTEPVSVDYPDFAALVARAIREKRVDLGILVCGTGIGMSIAANKYPGIRAALCRTEYEARLARAHNDANILCLGERVLGNGLALSIVESFISTSFEGGRHLQRVTKICDAERDNRATLEKT